MSDSASSRSVEDRSFTPSLGTVVAAERAYLGDRRVCNDLPSLEDDPALWGLAFSGGGVRSATFCLGVIQALTRHGHAKRFDYLSTVSGGGYIGSCLSSLLSGRSDTGLDHESSPFTGLREHDDYGAPEETKLSVRHQMHHLRTHGEYLIPRSHLLSRDVQRAVGSVLPGVAHTVLLFALLFVTCVAAIHLLLTGIEQDLKTLTPTVSLEIPGAEEMNTLQYVKAVLGAWTDQRLAPPFRKLTTEAGRCTRPLLAALFLGGLWNIIAILHATRLAARFKPATTPPGETTRAGWTPEDERESRFVRRFNMWSVGVAMALMMGTSLLCRIRADSDEFLAALLVPLSFAVGGLFVSHALTHLLESRYARKSWIPGVENLESRFRRSLYGSLRGACLYGTAAAIAVPVVLIVLFALSDLPMKFFWSLAALAWAYFASRKVGDAATSQLGGWLHRPLANVAVMLFLAFAFAQVSAWLILFYRVLDPSRIWWYSLITGAVSLLAFLLLGTSVDANRISPHYFYRDRLTEAYLKTDARTVRSQPTHQGMPLAILRDNEDLRLADLGVANGRGPYHLIVAALNLTGSEELNRKSFLSDHFIFSRDYIGSPVTGWVRTSVYRQGTTRLARAMAISAAAVGSAMGQHTFAAQAFVTTLFNARLGFWTENPWIYRDGVPKRHRQRWTFWPWYLVLEVFGLTSAREPLVNVSDGGHTGDNLGLLPLLQRRCSTIVVCDAEADGDYTFGSFNNAVRMALIEENIEINIDLTPIIEHRQTPGGFNVSPTSVVTGEILYPKNESDQSGAIGRLVYIKASVSGRKVSVHVANYARDHTAFPHETTADQFFDDAQFEAYRALGESLGRQATRVL